MNAFGISIIAYFLHSLIVRIIAQRIMVGQYIIEYLFTFENTLGITMFIAEHRECSFVMTIPFDFKIKYVAIFNESHITG